VHARAQTRNVIMLGTISHRAIPTTMQYCSRISGASSSGEMLARLLQILALWLTPFSSHVHCSLSVIGIPILLHSCRKVSIDWHRLYGRMPDEACQATSTSTYTAQARRRRWQTGGTSATREDQWGFCGHRLSQHQKRILKFNH